MKSYKDNRVENIFTQKLSVVLLSVPLVLSAPVMAGPTAFVERFEAVAKDGAIPGASSVDTIWGMHQPRITRHADGSIRILYISRDYQGNISWNVMRRSPVGQWSKEAAGPTTDDVVLMRDAQSDRAHVLAWPASVPTMFTSPGYVGSKVPGSWQVMASSSRHYGNAGIGLDGTLCLKASREFYTGTLTANSNTEYSCGKFSAASSAWSWFGFFAYPVGHRHAYDYLFPNPAGLAGGLYATSTKDVHKNADVPELDPMYGNYIFNGLRFYTTGISSTAPWRKVDTRITPYIAPDVQIATGQRVTTPMQRLHESFIDSKGRIFSNYLGSDPTNSTVQGLYTSVSNASGYTLFKGKWAALPGYGYTRVFEDAKNRLWLLWTNQGSQITQVRLYPIVESTVNGAVSFTLGSFTELSSSFKPYAIQGSLFITAPRGGNTKEMFVDAIYNTCWTTYQAGINFNGAQCYNADKTGSVRVFYARIRLPD